jgi:hypothetical protein
MCGTHHHNKLFCAGEAGQGLHSIISRPAATPGPSPRTARLLQQCRAQVARGRWRQVRVPTPVATQGVGLVLCLGSQLCVLCVLVRVRAAALC